MVTCFVPQCHHRSDAKDRTCKGFKTFPTDVRLRKKWINLIRRKDREPNSVSQVCSCHFIGEDVSKLPCIFPWNEKKCYLFNSFEKRRSLKILDRSSYETVVVASVPDVADVSRKVADASEMNVGNDSEINVADTSETNLGSDSEINVADASEMNVANGLEINVVSQVQNRDIGPIISNAKNASADISAVNSPSTEDAVLPHELVSSVSLSCTKHVQIVRQQEEIRSLKEEISRLSIYEKEVDRQHEEIELLKEEISRLSEEISRLSIHKGEVDRQQKEIESLKNKILWLPTSGIEVDVITEEMKKLKVENENLGKRILVFQTILEDEKLCYHYTGLSCKVVLLLCDLLQRISENYTINSVRIQGTGDQLLITLLRLRRNLSYRDLAFRFGVSVSTVQTVFTTVLPVLHEVLFRQFMDIIPSREKNQMFIPECFKSHPNVRVVLDCTEFSCDIPKNMERQKAIYSYYKGRTTVKIETACSDNGCITFCSPAYPGSTSDKAIVEHSGILSHLVAGDVVLADKGFLINDLLPPGVSLNIPAFLNDPEFTEDDVFDNRSKSRARIHIERLNARIKRFQICNHFPRKLFSSCEMIVQTCCALINLQNPVMAECAEFFESIGKAANDVS